MITAEELKGVLKKNKFKSSVIGSTDNFIFEFTEIYIFRDGKPLGIYEIIKKGDNFTIIISHTFQDVFTDNFKNITLNVSDDSRFPVNINLDSLQLHQGRGFDILLE